MEHDVAARIAALESELATLKHEVAARPEPDSSRRDLFKKLAIAGAGAAAGAVVLAQPAGAVDGAAILAGTVNTSQTDTILYYDAAGSPPPGRGILKVVDSLVDQNNSIYPSALNGWAYGKVQSGVFGYTTQANGYALVGWSNFTAGAGLLARGPVRANVELLAEGDPGPARAVDHQLGEIVCDSVGDLWLCVVAGNPGEWRQLGGATTSGQLHLLAAPARVYDSRPGGSNDGPLSGGATRVVSLTGTVATPGVPAGATGALVSLTLDATVSSGFLALFSNAVAYPGNSNVNWYTNGQILAVTTVSAVDATGKIKVLAGGPGSTQFIIDVIGYYR
jgi:hypothetical protein